MIPLTCIKENEKLQATPSGTNVIINKEQQQERLRFVLYTLNSLKYGFNCELSPAITFKERKIYNFTGYKIEINEKNDALNTKKIAIKFSDIKNMHSLLFPLETEFLIICSFNPAWNVEFYHSTIGNSQITGTVLFAVNEIVQHASSQLSVKSPTPTPVPLFAVGNIIKHRSSPLSVQIPPSIPRLIGVTEYLTNTLLNHCRLNIDRSGMCQVFMFDLRRLDRPLRQAILQVISHDLMMNIQDNLFHEDFIILYSSNGGKLFTICPIKKISGNRFELSHNGELVDKTSYALECREDQVEMMMGNKSILTFYKQTESEVLLFFQRFALGNKAIFLDKQSNQVSLVLKVSQSVAARDIFFAVTKNARFDTRTLAIPNRSLESYKDINICAHKHQIGDPMMFEYPVVGVDRPISINAVIPAESLNNELRNYNGCLITTLNHRIEDNHYSFSLRPNPDHFFEPNTPPPPSSLSLTKVDKPPSLYMLGFSRYLRTLPGVMEGKDFVLKILIDMLTIPTNDIALIKKETSDRPVATVLEYLQIEADPSIPGTCIFLGNYLDDSKNPE